MHFSEYKSRPVKTKKLDNTGSKFIDRIATTELKKPRTANNPFGLRRSSCPARNADLMSDSLEQDAESLSSDSTEEKLDLRSRNKEVKSDSNSVSNSVTKVNEEAKSVSCSSSEEDKSDSTSKEMPEKEWNIDSPGLHPALLKSLSQTGSIQSPSILNDYKTLAMMSTNATPFSAATPTQTFTHSIKNIIPRPTSFVNQS